MYHHAPLKEGTSLFYFSIKFINTKFLFLAVAFMVTQFSFGQNKDLSGVYLNHAESGKTFECVLKRICDTSYFFQIAEFDIYRNDFPSHYPKIGVLSLKGGRFATIYAYSDAFSLLSGRENEIELDSIKRKDPYVASPPFLGRYKKTHDFNPGAFIFLPYGEDSYNYYEAIEDWKYIKVYGLPFSCNYKKISIKKGDGLKVYNTPVLFNHRGGSKAIDPTYNLIELIHLGVSDFYWMKFEKYLPLSYNPAENPFKFMYGVVDGKK